MPIFFDSTHPVTTMQTWASENIPHDNRCVWDQVIFIRNLPKIFCSSFEEFEAVSDSIRLLGVHTSKSQKLPVAEITVESLGLTIQLANNFYYWSVTVDSQRPIKLDRKYLNGIVEPNNERYLDDSYFYVPTIHPCYDKSNMKQFSCVVGNNHELFTFLHLIKVALSSPSSR